MFGVLLHLVRGEGGGSAINAHALMQFGKFNSWPFWVADSVFVAVSDISLRMMVTAVIHSS